MNAAKLLAFRQPFYELGIRFSDDELIRKCFRLHVFGRCPKCDSKMTSIVKHDKYYFKVLEANCQGCDFNFTITEDEFTRFTTDEIIERIVKGMPPLSIKVAAIT